MTGSVSVPHHKAPFHCKHRSRPIYICSPQTCTCFGWNGISKPVSSKEALWARSNENSGKKGMMIGSYQLNYLLYAGELLGCSKAHTKRMLELFISNGFDWFQHIPTTAEFPSNTAFIRSMIWASMYVSPLLHRTVRSTWSSAPWCLKKPLDDIASCLAFFLSTPVGCRFGR